MESELLRIERDFKGHEPGVDISGFHSFVLQQNYSKEVSICLLSPLAHIPCFLQTLQGTLQSSLPSEIALVKVSESLNSASLLCSLSSIQHSGPLLPA